MLTGQIRNYRDPYQRNRQVAFLPACMSTSGRIHGELLRLLFFLSNKQADDYFEVLGYQAHKEEFCHRGGAGGGRGARRGVSNLPPGHRVADGFRWADRDASA